MSDETATAMPDLAQVRAEAEAAKVRAVALLDQVRPAARELLAVWKRSDEAVEAGVAAVLATMPEQRHEAGGVDGLRQAFDGLTGSAALFEVLASLSDAFDVEGLASRT